MRKIACVWTLVAAVPFALLPLRAFADAKTSYVASTGGGTACTLTSPCNSLQVAHDATSFGGRIMCLDEGEILGAAAISKSITIDCRDKSNWTTFIIINGTDITVRIRGLVLNGATNAGSTAIDFQNGAALIIEDCTIERFQSSPPIGIRFRPSSGTAQLVVTDTSVISVGFNATGGGIVVNPQAGGAAEVVLSRITVSKNVFGIAADGTGSTGGINMTITDSVSAGNSQDGIVATTPSGGAPIAILVKNTRSVNNMIGIRAIGPNVTVRVDGSTVTGNGSGLSFSNGGALLTFGNNNVIANGANGGFSGSLAPQ